MSFLDQMLGAQRAYARAQLGVSKICLEQQLYRNLMCNMCGLSGSSCYCGPCGGAAVASNCCIDSSNVTHETIKDHQAKNTILLYLASKDIKTSAALKQVFDQGKGASADETAWTYNNAVNGAGEETAETLFARITGGAKRFAVFLIEKKNATFVQ